MGWCGAPPQAQLWVLEATVKGMFLAGGGASAQLRFPAVMQSGGTKRPLAVTAEFY